MKISNQLPSVKGLLTQRLSWFWLLVWLNLAPAALAATNCAIQSDIPPAQCQALLDLYNSTGGPSWNDSPTNNWNVTNTPCTWTGVTCFGGVVTRIIRQSMNLTGTLPSSLSALTSLQSLWLSSNQLTGSIPDWSALTGLQYLYLSSNQLTGSIPDWSALTSLLTLSLSENQLTGSIPDWSALTSLQELNLYSNQLTGSIPDWSALTSLLTLDLRVNQLTGSIPDWSALTSLQVLGLSSNQLTGSIPDWSALTSLQEFSLSSNQLTGSIPDWSALTSLKYLVLSFTQLTGSIPDWSALTSLWYLDLSSNQLTGPLSGLPASLTALYLQQNQLSGIIPDLNVATNLSRVDLSCNQFTGETGGSATARDSDWATTQCYPPLAPTGLTATPVSDTQIDLSWTDNSINETGFKIESPVGTLINTAAANVTSYNHTGLTCNTSYTYSLVATNAGSDSTPMTATATTLACPPPAAPTDLTATVISPTQIDLSWTDNSTDETGFKIESPVGTLINTTAANVTRYSHTGLTCHTTYTYSLVAINASGDSTPMTATATTLACPPPAAPTDLTATVISPTQIDLSWTDNSTDETGFKIESPVGTLINTTAANVTRYSHTGLTCNTSYTYSLVAMNASGDSTPLTTTATTTSCPITTDPTSIGFLIKYSIVYLPQNTVTLTVTRTGGSQGAMTIDYATLDDTAISGKDYQATTGTLTWADGTQGEKTLTVNLLTSATVGRAFTVTLSHLTGANSSLGINPATVIIVANNPTTTGSLSAEANNLVSFSTKNLNASRQAGVANFIVNRNGTQGSLTVDYLTRDGSALRDRDYLTAQGTLTWAEGERGDKTVPVTLVNTATVGTTFSLQLSHLLVNGQPDTQAQLGIQTATLLITNEAVPVSSPATTGSPTSSLPPATDGAGAITGPAIIDTTTSPVATSWLTPSFPDAGPISNAGGQALPSLITATSSISNAVATTNTENHGLLSNLTVLPEVILIGGQLTGTTVNQGTLKDVEFLGISLSGGTLAGTIINNSQVGGIIQDVTLAPGTTLSGGKLGGLITAAPDSTISDVELVPHTTINGGILAGNIRGTPGQPGTLMGNTFSPGTTLTDVNVVSPVELPDDVVIDSGVTLPPPEEVAVNNVLAPAQIQHLEAKVLSTLPPEAISTLDAEQIQQIPPPAFGGLTAEQSAALSQPAVAALNGEQVAQIPPVAFSGFSAEQVAVLPPATMAEITSEQVSQIPPPAFQKVSAEQLAMVNKEALAGMTPAQFFYLPTASLGGLTSENMGGLSPAVMNQFTKDQLDALQPTEFQNLSAADVGKLVINVDLNKVRVEDVAPLIPPSWELNPTTGALTPPVGTPLTFQEFLPLEKTSPLVILPPLSNLESSFGIGGQGGDTAQAEMNQAIQQTAVPQLTLSQNPRGIVEVKGTEEYKNVNFSFICPAGAWTTQGDPQTPPTVAVTEGGFYQVTTATAQQFTMIPAPKDPEDLSKVLEDSSVIVGKRGDVFLDVPNQVRQSSRVREVVLFDSLIEPAPADFCEEIAGETVCDFENAPLEQQPGIHEVIEEGLRQKTGVARQKKIIYTDGTAQILYPTVLSPGTFIDQAQTTLTGTEKVILQANGIFKIFYQGNRYLAIPNSEVKSRELKPDEEIKPSVVLQDDGHLIYTVTLERPAVASGTRQAGSQEGAAREVLVFDLLMEPAPEEMCEEIAGLVVCDLSETPPVAEGP